MKSDSKKFRNCLNIFIIFAFGMFFTMPAIAQENVIQSVMISKAKDKASGYELNIDSTQAVQYKANIDEDGSIYFDLKNSVLAQDVGTIYDDVSNIDNVTVKQLDKNKVRIYVKGSDVKNTELVFLNALFEPNPKPAKQLILNRPINQYQPTISDEIEIEEDVQAWDDNSFNFVHLGTTLLSKLKEGPWGMGLILLSIFAFGLFIIKSLATKLSQEKEPLIGLKNQRYEQDITLGTNVIKNYPQQQNLTKKYVENDDLISVSHRNETLRAAQKELERAHQKYQDYLQNKYKDKKPSQINIDAVKKGIALNQYQKSTQNPYKNQEVIKINKDFTQSLRNSHDDFRIPPRPKMPQRAEFSSPYIQKPAPKVNLPNSNQKVNNMRFLESVTKIYEQSGRGDLASGLKNSISKAKQSI